VHWNNINALALHASNNILRDTERDKDRLREKTREDILFIYFKQSLVIQNNIWIMSKKKKKSCVIL
jgi:hypothetical protein